MKLTKYLVLGSIGLFITLSAGRVGSIVASMPPPTKEHQFVRCLSTFIHIAPGETDYNRDHIASVCREAADKFRESLVENGQSSTDATGAVAEVEQRVYQRHLLLVPKCPKKQQGGPIA